MEIGNWVTGKYVGTTQFIGFIERILDDLYIIQIVYPHESTIKRDIKDFTLLESEIHPDDFPILIDLALLTKDREWFEQLTSKRFMDFKTGS